MAKVIKPLCIWTGDDQQLERLAVDHPDAEELNLRCVRNITDAGLAHLANLTNLQSLDLESTDVTGTGLKHLADLASLQELDLGYTKITDAGLTHLADLASLQELDLGCTKITDVGIAHLANLANLQKLDLMSTRVTNAGLTHLADLASLQKLDLMSTRVTNAGLAHLANLANLQKLNLMSTGVTDAGLAHLANLANLQKLNLMSTGVTDAGLAHLANLINLQELNLYGTKVTDAGLAHLANLTNLENLDLRHTKVTDAGLARLVNLANLQKLHLYGTRVTKAGLEEFWRDLKARKSAGAGQVLLASPVSSNTSKTTVAVASVSGAESSSKPVVEAEEPATAAVLALPERTSDDLVSRVKEKLAAVGYLADDRLAAQMALLLVTDSDMVRTALLEGPAGAGKTHLAKSVAKILGCKVLYIQAASNSSPENFLYDVNLTKVLQGAAGDREAVKSEQDVTQLGFLPQVFQESQNGPVVAFVDELDKSSPKVDGLFLSALQEGEVIVPGHGVIKAKLENLVLFLIKNKERDVSEPLMRRCRRVQLTHPGKVLKKAILMGQLKKGGGTEPLIVDAEPVEGVPEGIVEVLTMLGERLEVREKAEEVLKAPAVQELEQAGKDVVRLARWGQLEHAGEVVASWLAGFEEDRGVLARMVSPAKLQKLLETACRAAGSQAFSRMEKNDPGVPTAA